MVWVGAGSILFAALVFLLWKGRGNTFFYDDWWWIEFRRSGIRSILVSYNQHLQVLPTAIYRLLFHTVGITHYRYYRVVAALAHLACATAIFAFALRRIGRPAVLILIPVAFFGSGYEFILWALNFGFPSSIALSITALICLERDERRGSIAACALLSFGLLFSETALLFAVGVAVELTWRDRDLKRLWVWGVPVALYAAWWVFFYHSYSSRGSVGEMAKFAAELPAAAAGGMFGLGLHLGWIVLGALLLVIGARIVRHGALSPRLVGLGVTLGTFWALLAFSRAQFGDPAASRYVYTAAVLLLLLLLESLRGVHSKQRGVLALVALGCGLSLVGNLRAFDHGEATLYRGSRAEAAELGALALARATAPAGLVVDPHWSPQIVAGAYFSAAAALNSTPADQPGLLGRRSGEIRVAEDLVLVRAREVQVRYASPRSALSTKPLITELALRGRLSSRGGCVRFVPRGPSARLDLALPATGIELRAAGTPRASRVAGEVRVRRYADGYYNAPISYLARDSPITVAVSRDGSSRSWHLSISPYEPVSACALSRS